MREITNKINILFIIMQMEMGGSERLVHNLVLKLDRNIFNPSIAWFFGDRVLKEFQDLNVPLYHVPKVKRIDFNAMAKMGEIIRANNIHIVNAHHFMSMIYAFYGCKIKNRAKLIYTEHSEWEIEKISWNWAKIGAYLLNCADGAVGINATVARKIRHKFGIGDGKVFTIQNGVNLGAFENYNDKSVLRKELGLAEHERIIGIVANLKKVKNHIFLLEAFYELIKDCKNIKLLLIGQGFKYDPENSELEIRKFVVEKGLNQKILFLGYRSDIPELLSIMDIFCLTSFKEGLPISLIEAMAAGLPVVGTHVEGIQDVIIPKENGFLVNIDDVEGLKKVLLALLRDETLRQKMGQKSKTLAKNNYSLDRCIKEYEDLFITINKKRNYVMQKKYTVSLKILTNHGGQEASPTWKSVTTRLPFERNGLLSSLKLAIRLYSMRKNFDCIVLGAGRSDVVFALMQSLLPFRKIHCIMIDCLWAKNLNTLKHKFKKVIFKIINKSVDRYIVWAKHEIKDFSQTFSLPSEKFVFVPYHTTNAEHYKIKPIDGGYIFSGGNSDRDYNTLIEAVRGLPVKVVIASTTFRLCSDDSLPDNVDIRGYSEEEYLKKMAECSINIVALAPGLLRSAGQQTFLNSMLLGKPTIVTDPEGAVDYINNYEDGLFVPPNDVIALREAILLLLNNPEKAKVMGEKAMKKAIKYSTEEHFKKIITVVNEVISK